MQHTRLVSPAKRWIGSCATEGSGGVTRSRLLPAIALVALTAGPVFAQQPPAPSPQPQQPRAQPRSAPKAAPAPVPPPAPTAADLAVQGAGLAQAGDHAGAVPLLQRAHEMEPRSFAYRFELAQALRQSGNCAEAIPHYKALIEVAPDPDAQQKVRSSMELCPEAAPDKLAAPALPPPPPPPPASTGISRSNAALMVGAGVGLAAAVVFFAGSRLDVGDADRARTVDDHDHISGRSHLWLGASLITGGAGIALAVLATVRHERDKRGTEISISPRAGGGVAVGLGGSF